MTEPGFNTLAIHAGQEPDPRTGAVAVAIYQTSTYKQDGVGGLRGGYEYSRSANPTRTALEDCLAALEGSGLAGSGLGGSALAGSGLNGSAVDGSAVDGSAMVGGARERGARGLAFASGLAAEDALLRTVCAPGDHVILPGDAYGGTFRLVSRVFGRWGVEHTAVALDDLDAVRAAVRDTTRVIWCETPTNPLLGVADIAALAAIAHDAGALLAVDNTFASPYLQQPLALGADVVVHSTTKYLGGHSDVVGGALVAGSAELGERLAFHQNAMGAIAGPFDAWLVLRGIKTLGVRMDRHCANAVRVVEALSAHDAVTEVRYPGLPSHPGHDVAARQMSGFGGMVSFRVRGGQDAALRVCERARVFTLGESLGGVESLIEHPGLMTHASVSGSPQEVPGDLIRLSVGIEDVEDLLADLDQALR